MILWGMEKLCTAKSIIKTNIPIFIGACLCIYFSYHIYYGERSLSRLSEIQKEIDSQARDLDVVLKDRAELSYRVSLLRPKSISKDILDEQARILLGYSMENDIVIVGN